jgi:hypothetical protein
MGTETEMGMGMGLAVRCANGSVAGRRLLVFPLGRNKDGRQAQDMKEVKLSFPFCSLQRYLYPLGATKSVVKE